MTADQISAYVSQLTTKAAGDSSAPEDFRYFAYFVELPGCFAQGPSREAAVQQLEEIAPAFVQMIIDAKGDLPRPASSRIVKTNYLKITGIIVGDLTKIRQQPVASRDTFLGAPVVRHAARKGLLVPA